MPAVTPGSDTNGVSAVAQHGEAEARAEEGQDRARPGSKKSASLAIDTVRPGDHQTVQGGEHTFTFTIMKILVTLIVIATPHVMVNPKEERPKQR